MSLFAQTIPEPPMVQHLLLENPWPVFIVLIGIAAVMRTIATRNQKPRLNYGVLALVIAAIGVIAAARLITTPRERLIQLTHDLVNTTVHPVDRDRLHLLVGPRTTLSGPDGHVWVDAGTMHAEMDAALERYKLAGHGVKILGAAADSPTVGYTQFTLRTSFVGDQMPPQHTTWLITWRRDSPNDAWRVDDIRWLEWMNQTPPRGAWR